MKDVFYFQSCFFLFTQSGVWSCQVSWKFRRNQFSSIVGAQFFFLLYSVCRFTNRPFPINNIYFYWYLFALTFRTLFVLYTCSSVHSASSYPLIAIRETPSTHWSVNVSLTLHPSYILETSYLYAINH
jgi:hypothetical protein